MAIYPGLDVDDMERLNALASSEKERRPSFDEAYALLSNGSPREPAEEAWNDFTAYWDGPSEPVPTTVAEPVTEGENPAVHLCHAECQSDAPFLTSWCGIALEDSGQTDAPVAQSEGRDLCADCLAARGCPVCGTVLLPDMDR